MRGAQQVGKSIPTTISLLESSEESEKKRTVAQEAPTAVYQLL